MALQTAPGTTSRSEYFLLRDSETGEAKTGLTSASSGAKASYIRSGGTAVSFSLSDLAAADSAYSSGGMKEVSSANAPGIYRLDVPNAAYAAGAAAVHVSLTFDSTLAEGLTVELRNPVSNVGSGAIEYTVLVQNSGLTPIAGAEVWLSTDSAGTNVIAGALSTDASGLATFYVDAGSYYLWVSAESYTGTNPTSVTVS